jgi:hypothetical protein
LRDGFALSGAAGPGPKKSVDVFVDSKGACPARDFKAFGTWTLTLS